MAAGTLLLLRKFCTSMDSRSEYRQMTTSSRDEAGCVGIHLVSSHSLVDDDWEWVPEHTTTHKSKQQAPPLTQDGREGRSLHKLLAPGGVPQSQ